MIRAVRLSGQFWTAAKRKQVADMLRRYGDAVRFYACHLWTAPETKYQAFGDTRLSARLKTAAHRQADGMICATRESARARGITPGCPEPEFVPAKLDAKNVTVTVEPPNPKSLFDVFVKVRALHNEWIVLPCKATARLRYWLTKPSAKLVQGCELTEDSVILWIDVPDPPVRTTGDELGIDLGVNKVVTTSGGQFIGTGWKRVSRIVRRKKPGSKGMLRARRFRDQYLRRCVTQLPWATLAVLAVEDLVGLKTGKRRGRGKSFRKALAPWSYRQVLSSVQQKVQEYGVLLVPVPPRGTSRTCPACGREHKLNRRDEDFLCLSCGHAGDADRIAAGNILTRARTLPAWSR